MNSRFQLLPRGNVTDQRIVSCYANTEIIGEEHFPVGSRHNKKINERVERSAERGKYERATKMSWHCKQPQPATVSTSHPSGTVNLLNSHARCKHPVSATVLQVTYHIIMEIISYNFFIAPRPLLETLLYIKRQTE